MTNAMKIYVACLASYNSGILHGEWIDLDGLDAEDLQKEINSILAASPEPDAEEWAVHDYEGPDLGEHPNLGQLIEVAKLHKEHGKAFQVYLEDIGGSADEFEDHYMGEFATETDFAEHLAEESGIYNKLKEIGLQESYFDAEAYANDLFCGGYRLVKGQVFSN